MNPKINAKERGLIKGAIRRVFSRSELRAKVLDASRIKHSDANRPRVTKWSICADCKRPEPTYKCQVDHMIPVQALGVLLEEMTWDELIDRIWCDESNLQVLCLDCHKKKSQTENKERRRIKKERAK